ncbi:MAG: serine/threonine-protein kinase [Nostocoides sp.]
MGEVVGGRYELLDLIGEGGTGSVWVARDREEDRLVAAKVLRQSDASSLMRFVREQSMRVEHPNVLAPTGWVGSDANVVLIMPLVRGGSLADLVGDFGGLPPLLVAEVLRQVVAALDSVHQAGIIHRDVKPANVLLQATGQERPHAYLSDFSISVDTRGPRMTHVGTVVGTLTYMAPERQAGAVGDASSDMYAVGQLAKELLTGLPPSSPHAPELPLTTPLALVRLLEALTSRDSARRPTAAETLGVLGGDELAWDQRAMGEVEVLEHVGAAPSVPPTPTQVQVAENRGRPVPLWAGSLAAALLLASLALLVLALS